MPLDIKEKTITSLLWKLLERGGKATVDLVVQIVMARLLAPELFGALAIMLVFINIGNVIVQSGLNTALVQIPDVGEDDYSTVFWMSFAVSIVLALAIFLFAPLVSRFYSIPAMLHPLRALSLLLLINAYNSVQVAKATRDLELRKVFNATIVSVLLSGSCGIILALNNFGLWALVVQQLVYQVSTCIVLAIQISWKPRFVFSSSRARVLFAFGSKLLASGLLDTGYQSLSDLIIGRQFSSTDLGYVSQGKKYPQALGMMLDGAIQPVMLSAVAHVQDDVISVKRLTRRALKTSTFLIVPCMGLFALLAEPLVRFLLGPQWVESVPFLQMYCFVYALLPIHTTNLQALNGMGRSDLFLKLEVLKKSYGIAVLFFTAFVLRDLYAMVAGYIVTGLISTFVNAYPNKKVIGYSYTEQLRDIAPAFVMTAISIAFALFMRFLPLSGIALIAIQCLVMVCSYIVMAEMFKVEAFIYLVRTCIDIIYKLRISKRIS